MSTGLRIAIDTLFEDPVAGSSAIDYLRELVRRLAHLDGDHVLILLASRTNRRLFNDLPPARVRIVTAGASNENLPLRILSQQTLEGLLALRERADVFFAPGNICPLWWPGPIVLKLSTLHHYETPREIGLARTAYRRLMFGLALRRANVVLANTEETKRGIVAHAATPASRVRVLYEAVSDDFSPHADPAEAPRLRREFGVEPGYVLFASALWKYKSPLFAADAFLRAVELLPSLTQFVVAGQDHEGTAARIHQRFSEAGLGPRLVYLGNVASGSMPALFRQAGVLLYPSQSETFGKPVVEAMRSGLPVCASDIPTLREVGASAPWYLPVRDCEAWAHAIGSVFTDAPLRERLVRQGMERGAAFSWDHATRETLAVLREAAAPLRTNGAPA